MAEKKKEEPQQTQAEDKNYEVVTLNNSSNKTSTSKSDTTKDDETTTTLKQDTNTTKVEQTVSPFVNVDGSVNEKAVADNEAKRRELADVYDVDPTTGRYKGTVGNLLGFDPEAYKREQEQKAKLNRWKQKEAGWRNALGVITDMVTTAGGGNVYLREPDKVSENAAAEVEKANANITALGTAIKNAKDGREKAWLKAEQDRLKEYIKNGSYKVMRSTTSGGGSQSIKQGGGSHTESTSTTNGYGTSQTAIRGNGSGSGSGSGGGNDKLFVVNLRDHNMNITDHTKYGLSSEEYAAVKKILKERYNKILHSKTNPAAAKSIKGYLLRAGAIDDNKNWKDEDIIMQGGDFWYLSDAEVKEIEKATGGKVRIRPTEEVQADAERVRKEKTILGLDGINEEQEQAENTASWVTE